MSLYLASRYDRQLNKSVDSEFMQFNFYVYESGALFVQLSLAAGVSSYSKAAGHSPHENINMSM